MANKQIKKEKIPFKMTRQRRIILDELKKVKSHPTAEEIYEMVKRKLPTISLATVYRNLEELSDHGTIQKIKTGGNLKRFDATTEDHVHIRCVKCGRVDDVHKKNLKEGENSVGQLNGYKVMGFTLEFFGYCLNCR